MLRSLTCGWLIVALASAAAAQTELVYPGATWSEKAPAELAFEADKLTDARDYALQTSGSGMIVRGGHAVLRWGDQAQRYDLKSSTKSLGATLVGVAVLDGKVKLDDLAIKYQPSLGVPPESNRQTGWIEKITIRHLLTQTSGFQKVGGYVPLDFEPGTKWFYSDSGPNWLAECVTLAYGRDCDELIFERVCGPLGITRNDFVWRKNAYRPHEIEGLPRREFGSGVHANVNALARIGLLYLRGGVWQGQRILPADYVAEAGKLAPNLRNLKVAEGDPHTAASNHYGLLFWNNADGTLENVPRDAFWSWGLFDSFIMVIPSLDIVVARAGPAQSWKREPGGKPYDVLRPFLGPIAAAVRQDREGKEKDGADRGRTTKAQYAKRDLKPAPEKSPVPPSPVVGSVEWAPASEIIRHARGGDNWPSTWGADDALYSAYGDANGWEPFLPKKLSMGIVRVTGNPPEIRGENLVAPTAEALGDGNKARKASGMLMLEDGTLYILVRNVGNSQLGWSNDQGRTWTWADWKFTTSFGCPTFLNFGKAYAGSRDHFVYIYSHDDESAYDRASRTVLARVPKDRLRDRGAYVFFVRQSTDGGAIWSPDIHQRGGVFENPDNCYRTSASYNAGLKRYLLCQINSGADTRFSGGFGIYDAPEPWGPWTTVYYTPQWDVGPGETNSLPTKWMSADGRTVHLLFSGDDYFSVRRAMLKTK